MRPLHQILRKPVITEKSNLQKETDRVITFEVDRTANKVEIKQAIEKAFGVQVEKVNTVVTAGKVKRFGRNVGKRSNRKKALVTLSEGSEIDFFGV